MSDAKSDETATNTTLAALTAAMSAGPAQKLDDKFYESRPQSYWTHDRTKWSEILDAPASLPASSGAGSMNASTIRLISWNIDILVPFVEERMSAALLHLKDIVTSTPSETPIVVFLQEMGQSDLQQIRESAWIQQRFYITEFDHHNWPSPLYGTQMLVDRRLRIENVFRLPFVSKFDRDGLFVDIGLSGNNSDKVLRLCNVHLESLVADPPVRPMQLQTAANHLKDNQVAGALLAGDLNAIQPFDRTLHLENHLKDAFLELGGVEDSDDGYTWGYQSGQAAREKFGCTRMDKILFRGDLTATKFERIGIAVMVAEDKREEIKKVGRLEWVTDHYGVMGDFELEDWMLKG
ncbi:hypothetical protein K504DRAFT_458334 [Pleomassaria siparia CBS 279.74]|uniref:Endonuclease/exonuclease/phosphatase domain-containing protein n=1 Tax=Pleomassaria siparia CBS 279.74 TaxID=1314801 RepID=A0A6G1K4N6_9PLEO|nr:hypothetical protein K504DRAFT_458334 [Pleomassaria siparia CBS 279.74]